MKRWKSCLFVGLMALSTLGLCLGLTVWSDAVFARHFDPLPVALAQEEQTASIPPLATITPMATSAASAATASVLSATPIASNVPLLSPTPIPTRNPESTPIPAESLESDQALQAMAGYYQLEWLSSASNGEFQTTSPQESIALRVAAGESMPVFVAISGEDAPVFRLFNPEFSEAPSAQQASLQTQQTEYAALFREFTGYQPDQSGFLCFIQNTLNEEGTAQKVDVLWQSLDYSDVENEKSTLVYRMQLDLQTMEFDCAVLNRALAQLPYGQEMTAFDVTIDDKEAVLWHGDKLSDWVIPELDGYYIWQKGWHGQYSQVLSAGAVLLPLDSTQPAVYASWNQSSFGYCAAAYPDVPLPGISAAISLEHFEESLSAPLSTPTPLPVALSVSVLSTPAPVDSSLGQQILAAVATEENRAAYFIADSFSMQNAKLQVQSLYHSENDATNAITAGQFQALKQRMAAVFTQTLGISPPENYACQIQADFSANFIEIFWRDRTETLGEMNGEASPVYHLLFDESANLIQAEITGDSLDINEQCQQLLHLNDFPNMQLRSISSTGDGEMIFSIAMPNGDSGEKFSIVSLDIVSFSPAALSSAAQQALAYLSQCLPPAERNALDAFLDSSNSLLEQSALDALGQLEAFSSSTPNLEGDLLYRGGDCLYAQGGNENAISAAEMATIQDAAATLFQSILGMDPRTNGLSCQILYSADTSYLEAFWLDPADSGACVYSMTLNNSQSFQTHAQGLSLPIRRMNVSLQSAISQQMQRALDEVLDYHLVEMRGIVQNDECSLVLLIDPANGGEAIYTCSFDRPQFSVLEFTQALNALNNQLP